MRFVFESDTEQQLTLSQLNVVHTCLSPETIPFSLNCSGKRDPRQKESNMKAAQCIPVTVAALLLVSVYRAATFLIAFALSTTSANASQCTSDCGSNTSLCQGEDYDTCSGCTNCGSKGKKTWRDPITRGTTAGNRTTYSVNVTCYTTWPCLANGANFPNRRCLTDTLCDIGYPGDECTYCGLGAATDHLVPTCYSENCVEE